ncbi:hypothetical protein Hdeb2414_s0027g00685431 [Helianthus debilis subsp. tardiflorus]
MFGFSNKTAGKSSPPRHVTGSSNPGATREGAHGTRKIKRSLSRGATD